MTQRQAQYKYTTCENCNKSIDVARLMDINFCSDTCRADYHRKQAKAMQVNRGAKILADQLKSTVQSIKMLLGDKAILAAMKEQKLTWSAKHKNYKDKSGKIYGQEQLDLEAGDDTPNRLKSVLKQVQLTYIEYLNLDTIEKAEFCGGLTKTNPMLNTETVEDLHKKHLLKTTPDGYHYEVTPTGKMKLKIVKAV